MLILSREIGEAVVINDVVVTVVRIDDDYLEISLVKATGGKSRVAVLPRQQSVDICYDAQVVFVGAKGTKARLGFEVPVEVTIQRREMWNG